MNEITARIRDWYRHNKRELPWRSTKDPYFIWVSEVLLQQTRVSQGNDFYISFVQKYPDIYSLAAANEEDVLKICQGIGYYSRARNLLHTARYIVSELGGVFPGRYQDIVSLKGIGPYTAAAIASIAFNEPVVAIDGNVFRVASRLFDIDYPIDKSSSRNVFDQYTSLILDQSNPGDFNQALMDLGSLICTPVNPKCGLCPVETYCKANQLGKSSILPVKQSKIEVKQKYYTYLVVSNDDFVAFKKRGKGNIWSGMYDFALWESDQAPSDIDIVNIIIPSFLTDGNLRIKKMGKTINHKLTHRSLWVRFIEIESNSLPKDCIWVANQQIGQLPVPKIIEKFILNRNIK